ncbi:MAG: hypothetical protein ACJ72W_29905 [Actinoallomurus sp.]
MALHLRDQGMSLRDIAFRLVITTGKRKGRHPPAATVMRMLREHDTKAALDSTAVRHEHHRRSRHGGPLTPSLSTPDQVCRIVVPRIVRKGIDTACLRALEGSLGHLHPLGCLQRGTQLVG